MKVTLYPNKNFAILETLNSKTTLNLNENGSILYSYSSDAMAWTTKYETLDELKLDNRLSDLEKWLAVGLLGMPGKK